MQPAGHCPITLIAIGKLSPQLAVASREFSNMHGSGAMWHHVEDVELTQGIFLGSLFNERTKLVWLFANDSEVKKPALSYFHSELQRTAPVMIATYLDGKEQEMENANHPVLTESVILQPYTDETFSLILKMIKGVIANTVCIKQA